MMPHSAALQQKLSHGQHLPEDPTLAPPLNKLVVSLKKGGGCMNPKLKCGLNTQTESEGTKVFPVFLVLS